MHYESYLWSYYPHFFIEFHKHNFKKPMGHLSLCQLKSTPCFKPTYATQINDPWTSVDMVLPVKIAVSNKQSRLKMIDNRNYRRNSYLWFQPFSCQTIVNRRPSVNTKMSIRKCQKISLKMPEKSHGAGNFQRKLSNFNRLFQLENKLSN